MSDNLYVINFHCEGCFESVFPLRIGFLPWVSFGLMLEEDVIQLAVNVADMASVLPSFHYDYTHSPWCQWHVCLVVFQSHRGEASYSGVMLMLLQQLLGLPVWRVECIGWLSQSNWNAIKPVSAATTSPPKKNKVKQIEGSDDLLMHKAYHLINGMTQADTMSCLFRLIKKNIHYTLVTWVTCFSVFPSVQISSCWRVCQVTWQHKKNLRTSSPGNRSLNMSSTFLWNFLSHVSDVPGITRALTQSTPCASKSLEQFSIFMPVSLVWLISLACLKPTTSMFPAPEQGEITKVQPKK